MGGNYFAKLIYFIVLIVLAILLIPTFSYYKLAWLIIYLLLGIVCFASAFTLTLFFMINIIIGLIFYVKSGNIIYLEMLFVLILGFVASTANIKQKKDCCHSGPVPKIPRAELINKELSSSTTEAPEVEVYGKVAKETKKTTKKTTKKKTTKKKTKKKTAKKKTTKRKTKKKATKKKITKKKTKKKKSKKRK